jgi:transcriptional regulator with XRE-family HTH domain
MAKKNSEFINRVKSLIAELGSNAELAKASRVSDSRIPEWTGGKRLPSPETLIKLGKIALEHGMSDPFFFWALAGMDTRALRLMAEHVLETRYKIGGEKVLIPRFRWAGNEMEEAGAPVEFSAEFVPNPHTTICLYIDESSEGIGDSPRGAILVDTSAAGSQWREELSQKVVILDYSPKAPTAWPVGLYMARLHRSGALAQAQRVWIQINMEVLSEAATRSFGWVVPIGTYTETAAALGATPDNKEQWQHAIAEFCERAISNLSLDQGVQILGKVIGRLTGHLEKPHEIANE